MTKTRIIALMLLIVTIIPMLASCHGSRGLDEATVPEEFDTTKNYEITFWAKNDTNVVQTSIYEKAIADFEKLYPNIKVTMRLYTDYSRIYNDVITNIATQTTPNVCITYPDHIATYMTGDNVVVPLDGFFADEKYGLGGSELKFTSPKKEEIIDKFMEECKINGIYYAIPYMRSTEACYMNKTYIEQLGYEIPDILTWDFIWEVADAATKKNEDGTYLLNGENVMIPFIYKSTDNMMIQMLRQCDGGYSDNDGNTLIFNDKTKEILYTVAEHVGKEAFSTFKISSYPANFLNAGRCVFAIDSTAGSTWMGADAPLSDICSDDIKPFEVAVRAIPQYDTSSPAMISQGPSVCVFNKRDNGEVLASWLFAQYLLTDEVQIAYAETEGYIPVTKTAHATDEYKDYLSRCGEDNDEHYAVKINATKMFIENIDNTFTTPVYNGSASLREAAGQLIENVTKSIRRKEKVDDDYIEKLYSDVNALYRLDERNNNASVGGKKDLGKLPGAAVALLTTLAVVWCGIIAYVARDYVKKHGKDCYKKQ